MTDNLFEPAEPEPEFGIRNGRYHYPAPPGETMNPRGFYRMTNLVSAFSDQEGLQLWLTWKAFEGLREHEVIFDEWMAEPLANLTPQERSALANLYAEKARRAAKADEAARRGTARHTMMDGYLTTGERAGTRSMLRQLDSAMEELDRQDFEILDTEFKVWHPAAGGTMGTSDARIMCRRTGQIGILDWKTQARFWTWQEIAGQLYGYDSAPWWWDAIDQAWKPATEQDLLGRPGTKLAGRRVAIVAHMPQAPGPGQLPVTLHQVDMEYGRNVLECAARNVELRSIGRSVALERMPAEVLQSSAS